MGFRARFLEEDLVVSSSRFVFMRMTCVFNMQYNCAYMH